jgi:hypothetical protein
MEDLYFKSIPCKTMFILLETDGVARLKFLGVNGMHYHNKDIAQDWYNNILDILNQEPSHISYDNAIRELNELYNAMIK